MLPLVANNGNSYTPHIVKGYLENGSKKIIPFKFKAIDVGIKQKGF